MTLTHSQDMDKLAPALAQLQANLGNVAHDAENPHFRHGYTSLPAFLEAVRGPLGEHGFSLSQHPGVNDLGHVIVETFLLHDSGQWIRSVAASPAVKPEPQAIGSAITYLRRYALAAVLNIAQEDDDAESAKPRAQGQARKPRHEAPAQRPGSGSAPSNEAPKPEPGITSKEIGAKMRELDLSGGDVAGYYGIEAKGDVVVHHVRGLIQAGATLDGEMRKVVLDRTARIEAAESAPKQSQEETVDEVEQRIIAEHTAKSVQAR